MWEDRAEDAPLVLPRPQTVDDRGNINVDRDVVLRELSRNGVELLLRNLPGAQENMAEIEPVGRDGEPDQPPVSKVEIEGLRLAMN